MLENRSGVPKIPAGSMREPMQGEWTQFNPTSEDGLRDYDPEDRSFALWAAGLLIGATIGWLIPALLPRVTSRWMGLGALIGLMIASWIDSIRRRRQEPDRS